MEADKLAVKSLGNLFNFKESINFNGVIKKNSGVSDNTNSNWFVISDDVEYFYA